MAKDSRLSRYFILVRITHFTRTKKLSPHVILVSGPRYKII